MSRFLAVAFACLLLTSCATESASTDLAGLAARVQARMDAVGTATYRTQLKWYVKPDASGSVVKTVVGGAWRHDRGGTSSSMHVRRGAHRVMRDIGDVVRVPGELYLKYPDKDVWSGYAEKDNADSYHSQVIGVRVPMTVAAELDYLAPSAAGLVGSMREDVDGTPATRYDVVADAAKMAPLVQDRSLRAELKRVAEKHGAITASVWVDRSGLPLKATSFMASDSYSRSTTRFADWGKPVKIAVPPAALVTWHR